MYDSCYTVKRIMDYPYIGRRVEEIKNCCILAECWVVKAILCENKHGFVNACSIQCCTGNLCNNDSLQPTRSSVPRAMHVTPSKIVARASFARADTSHVSQTHLTALVSGISVTSSSITRFSEATKHINSSWTSAKTRPVFSNSVMLSVERNTVKVQAAFASADRFLIPHYFLLLMATFGSATFVSGKF